MDRLKYLYSKLLTCQNDLQTKFNDFYKSGIDANATYKWANKTIVETENFPEAFIQDKLSYENCLKKFKTSKSRFDLRRRIYRSVIKQPFTSRLNFKFSNIIHTHRTIQIKIEFSNELKKSRARVHDFTGLLDKHEEIYKILVKGPNFIPTTMNSDKDTCKEIRKNIIEALHKYSIKATHEKTSTYNKNITLSLNLNHPNLDWRSYNYAIDILEKSSKIDEHILETEPMNNNLDRSDYFNIKQLAKDNNTIINIADKNLGFSINHIEWYVNEYKRQLADKEIYEEKNYTDMEQIISKGYSDLRKIHNKYHQDDDLIAYNIDILTNRDINKIKLPTLNIVPKVHKLKATADRSNEQELKGRPIVNGFATINTEPSKLLAEIFDDCLLRLSEKFREKGMKIPIVKSSKQVVERLTLINMQNYNLDNIYFISFDFSSLYTAIKKWTVFDTIHFLGAILKLNESEILIMKELFTFIKQYAYFTVGNELLYVQKEGFAMGSYGSGDGSSLVLLKSEYYMLQNTGINKHILEFFRYIDDGSMIVHIHQNCIKDFITKIASYYPKELEIEFTVNKFQTVFLDLTYGLGHNTYKYGRLHYRIYQKPFNAYAYLDFSSNHPFGVFKGMINAECHRYRSHSCDETEYDHVCKLFISRLKKCRHPKAFIKKHMLKYIPDKKYEAKRKKPRNTICKVLFNKIYNQHLLYKRIFQSKWITRNTSSISICNKTRTKLKTLLLTKKKLHDKLAPHI